MSTSSSSSSNITLMVVISNVEEYYRHWGLFLDDFENPQPGHNFLQVKGPLGGHWYESERFNNWYEVPEVKDLVYLCEVNVNLLDIIREVAQKIPIGNDIPIWNSQDYVVSLLDNLEARGILDSTDERYAQKKRIVCNMRQGVNLKVW
ncbi:uncharacterized protein KD926_008140 [Aspergillus affinis]|uniref:uncharacterized protein n=1 Tax=Aspergillus affinis TaxID=1070780 RepID=UPI0022FE0DFD|nr:uncharacterized protein KD926_008140 [Aspergillus affinis]KAI9040573.1 hypothetical protein KD926_008140 [Aspergillus affinis]